MSKLTESEIAEAREYDEARERGDNERLCIRMGREKNPVLGLEHAISFDIAIAAMKRLAARVKELETRLAAAEERGIAYHGVFDRAKSYRQGDAVTFDGSLWIALAISKGCVPDKSGALWRLAVKRGRDGKDLRP